MRKKYLNNTGNIAIVLCFVMTGLLAFSAYVIDIGIVYVQRIELSNAIDSAALAGALELPTNKEKALQKAIEYLQLNNVDVNRTNISIGEEGKSIIIESTKDVNHLFAVVFNKELSTIHVSNQAFVGTVKSVEGGIRPFAVEVFDYSYGDLVVLKENAGDSYNGNFGTVALGGTGNSILEDNILNGYRGIITIGDNIDTEPGNKASALSAVKLYLSSDISTFENFTRNSKRIWTLPLVDTLEVDGRGQITVVGFAQFFVENVGKQSGQTELTGRFLRRVAQGEIDLTAIDYGTYAVKLIH